jgi:hypothetical protein
MSGQVTVNDPLLARFQEILPPERCEDWGAKLQELCEEFWELLEQDNQVTQRHVTAFIEVLLAEESFELVRLVIPELRSEPAAKPENKYKQQIIERTVSMRAKLATFQSTQAQFDEPQYRDEKNRLAEAELYRASLLLYNRGNLTVEQRNNVEKWMAARPGSAHPP